MRKKYKIKPYAHQLEAIELAKKHKDFALLWTMGTGKTGAAVNIIRDRYAENNRMMRTLILSPLVTLYNWKNEFELHSYIDQKKIIVLNGTKAKKMKELKRLINPVSGNVIENMIVVMNYESLLTEDIFQVLRKWKPEIVVLDESHYIKNHKAKRSKKAHILCSTAKHRYILSGTSILKNAQDIFMQYKCLDNGQTFGHNFYVFQRTYMHDANSAWAHSENHYPKWELREDKIEEMQQKIYSKATSVDIEECIDLPPLIEQTYKLDMIPKQAKMYKEMKRDLITFIETAEGNSAIVANATIVKAIRLMQIASGFVKDDKDNIIEIPNDPKSRAVRELLDDLVDDHKVILWCSFTHNYKVLGKLCSDMGINHVFLTGNQNLKEKQEAMDTFNKDPNCRVIIANRRAGGIGVNLVAASHSIIFSRNFSLGEELQSAARNRRGGSQIHKKIVRINLIMKDTIEEDVLAALQQKKDIADKILNIIKK